MAVVQGVSLRACLLLEPPKSRLAPVAEEDHGEPVRLGLRPLGDVGGSLRDEDLLLAMDDREDGIRSRCAHRFASALLAAVRCPSQVREEQRDPLLDLVDACEGRPGARRGGCGHEQRGRERSWSARSWSAHPGRARSRSPSTGSRRDAAQTTAVALARGSRPDREPSWRTSPHRPPQVPAHGTADPVAGARLSSWSRGQRGGDAVVTAHPGRS